ncbi:MAG: twin-arginine translocase TatA/TatE family subunit [bacterium]|nr:twin-arginine translocase TatA/TatE family subunit [bacterium]
MLPSPSEIMVILIAVLLLFGGKGLPGIARYVGKIMRKVQQASRDFQRELNIDLNDEDEPKKPELKG